MSITFDLILLRCRTLKQGIAFFGLAATVLLGSSLAEAQLYILPNSVQIELPKDVTGQPENIREASKIDRALVAAYQVFIRQNNPTAARSVLMQKLAQDLALKTADIEAAVVVYQRENDRILWNEKSWREIQQIGFGLKDLKRFSIRTAVLSLTDIKSLSNSNVTDEMFIGATASIIPMVQEMFTQRTLAIGERWKILTQLFALPTHAESGRMFMQIWLSDIVRIVDGSVFEKQTLDNEIKKFISNYDEDYRSKLLLFVAYGLLNKITPEPVPNWPARHKQLEKINFDLIESAKKQPEVLASMSQDYAKNITEILLPKNNIASVGKPGRDLVLVEMLKYVNRTDLVGVIQTFAHPDSRYDYTSNAFKTELAKRVRADRQSLQAELPAFLKQIAHSQANSDKVTKLDFIIGLKDLFRDGGDLQAQFEDIIFTRARNLIIQAADDFDEVDIESGLKLIDAVATLIPRVKFLELLNAVKVEIEKDVRRKLKVFEVYNVSHESEQYFEEDLAESKVYQKVLRYLQAQKADADVKNERHLPSVCSRILAPKN